MPSPASSASHRVRIVGARCVISWRWVSGQRIEHVVPGFGGVTRTTLLLLASRLRLTSPSLSARSTSSTALWRRRNEIVGDLADRWAGRAGVAQPRAPALL